MFNLFIIRHTSLAFCFYTFQLFVWVRMIARRDWLLNRLQTETKLTKWDQTFKVKNFADAKCFTIVHFQPKRQDLVFYKVLKLPFFSIRASTIYNLYVWVCFANASSVWQLHIIMICMCRKWYLLCNAYVGTINFDTWATSWENLFMPYANSKGTDQPAHPRSLISAFVVRCLDSIIPLLATAEISRS